jgi:hypothetical protein
VWCHRWLCLLSREGRGRDDRFSFNTGGSLTFMTVCCKQIPVLVVS